ncbi:hypothetical protein CRUP_031130 [Coryphaenoides rupestris]|nr:hypothetical protein CRUP_031130 [Coryphaenoides rupestris]
MMRRAAALCICGVLLVFSNLPQATATSWNEEPAALHWTTGAEGPCAVTLTPVGPCGQGQDTCSYWVHLPPLSVQLPKHLRDLDDIVKEIQRLKDTVDELRKSCGDCTVNPEERGEEAREQERGKDNHPQQIWARASERDNENENRGRGEEKNVKRERGKEGSEEERVIKGVYNSRQTAQTVNRRTFGEKNGPAGSKEDEVTVIQATVTQVTGTQATLPQAALTQVTLTQATVTQVKLTQATVTQVTLTQVTVTQATVTQATVTQYTVTQATVTQDTVTQDTVTQATVTKVIVTQGPALPSQDTLTLCP